MRLLGNIIWLIFGGLMIAVQYMVAGLIMMVTIIGIPFGLQAFKLALVALIPFNARVVPSRSQGGCLNTFFNIIWIFLAGIWIALTHVFWGLILFITIIGIPFGRQHFKLASLALTPFGYRVESY